MLATAGLDSVQEMFSFPFMVNAFRAGTVVAVVAGLVGWFMVLRRQTFAGHTLAVVGFPGAAGAVLLGVSATYGLFAFAVVAALRDRRHAPAGAAAVSEESAVTGTVQAFALALRLPVRLARRQLPRQQATARPALRHLPRASRSAQVALLAWVAAVVIAVLALIARPLLFASVDPDVAAARGVPVRAPRVRLPRPARRHGCRREPDHRACCWSSRCSSLRPPPHSC